MRFNYEVSHSTVPGLPTRIYAFLPTSEDAAQPDDVAVVQALYSRSDKSIEIALQEASADKTKSLMDKYYIGYGHSSIGEAAHILLCFEDVPMYAAMLLMHSHEYNGQARSTRYQDFSKGLYVDEHLNFKDLKDDPAHEAISPQGPIFQYLQHAFKTTFSIPEARARAGTFDVVRGFLPGGVFTSFSLNTNFTALRRLIARLRASPEALNSVAFGTQIVDQLEELADRVWPTSRIKVSPLTRDAKVWQPSLPVSDELFVTSPFSQPDDPELYDLTGTFSCSIGSARDFFRHRSVTWGFPRLDSFRSNEGDFSLFFEVAATCSGFYYEFGHIVFEKMCEVYKEDSRDWSTSPKRLERFRLGHQMKCVYKMPASALPYLVRTRTSPAAHFEVRMLTYRLAEKAWPRLLHLSDERFKHSNLFPAPSHFRVVSPDFKREDQTIIQKDQTK